MELKSMKVRQIKLLALLSILALVCSATSTLKSSLKLNHLSELELDKKIESEIEPIENAFDLNRLEAQDKI